MTDFDVPAHEPAVLSRVHFEEWAQHYLYSDPESRSRDPAGVKTPLGPFQMVVRRLLPIGGEARYQDRPGTHLMHLEAMRSSLWRESVHFLPGDDVSPVPA
jgi:hypothetical protein